ncbi:MAG: VWA domain-containing protein [Pseudomonadota bacterium]
MAEPTSDPERERRWRLALGTGEDALQGEDARLSAALSALYDADQDGAKKDRRRVGLGASAPKVARWLGDIRSFFPAEVVQVIQRDAFERLGLKRMLLEPEFLAAAEADVNLVADLVALRGVMPEKTKATARQVIAKVVAALMERLERRTAASLRGAIDRARRTHRPRPSDIDWPRTITANLRHYQPEHRTVVPERLVGFMRRQRRIVDLDEVVLCVDQSGSMGTSVVYASIFAAVMASLPVVSTKLICYDTVVLDLTDDLADPVEVLFGVQLGGGNDTPQALAYCETKIERPPKAHLILISDLFEGAGSAEMIARLTRLRDQGANVIVLLALSDQGRPSYDTENAREIAALGMPVFACTPERFPEMMATALRREDIAAWAARADIKLVRGGEEDGAV